MGTCYNKYVSCKNPRVLDREKGRVLSKGLFLMYHKGEGHPDKSMSKKNLRGTSREHHRDVLKWIVTSTKEHILLLDISI
jgi:hypothetical protein